MATKKGDVDLVIRGKNQASKPLDAVADSLVDLSKAQGAASAAAVTLGNTLTKIAADARTAGRDIGKAQDVTRKRALEMRRDMSQAAEGAGTVWRDAQAAIKQLRKEMVAVGPPTREQAQAMQALVTQARAAKGVTNDLQVSVERYNRVLRNQSATQKELGAATQAAKRSMLDVRGAAVAVAGVTQRAAQGVQRMGSANQRAAGQTETLDASLRSLFANSRRSLSVYQRIRGQVLSLTAGYVGLFGAIEGVNRVIEASLTMQGAESRLNVVTGGDLEKTAQELQWVRDEADRLGFGLNTLAAEWSKFAVSAQAAGISMADARKIFTSVSEAGRVLNLDTQRVERVYVALTQMMAKGTVQMEELRQQLGEHLPSAFADMAKAVGVSTAELVKMMSQGQVTSDYLVRFADVLGERYGGELPNALKRTQAEMGRFETQVTLALNKIADAGVIDAFTDALRELQEMLKTPEAEIWFQRLGAAIGGIIRLLMELLKHMDLVVVALSALGAAKGAVYVMQLGRSLVTVIQQMRTATTVARGLGLAMSASLGPVGLAVGLLAGAFAYLATRVSDSEKSMISARKTVEDITSAYRKGTRSAKDWADSLSGLSNLQIARDLENLKDKVKDDLEEIVQPFSRGYANRMRALNSPFASVVEEIRDLGEQARAGTIPLEEFRKRLDAIGEAHPQLKEVVLAMQDSAAEAIKSQDALNRFEAALRVMRGEATQADKELLGLADAIEETDDAASNGADGLKKYTEAMDALRKMVPQLKKELEFKTGLASVQANLQAAYDSVADQLAAGTITDAQANKMRQDAMDVANRAASELYRGLEDGINKALPLDSKSIEARIIQIESGGKATAKASTSSATGIAQFTSGTWLRLFDRVFPELAGMAKEAKLALRTNNEASRKMLSVLTRENQTALVRAGITPNAANTYLAHFLGAGDAIKVILANPDELASKIVDSDSVAANQSILGGGRTAGQLIAWATQKMGGGAPLQSSGWTKAETDAAAAQEKSLNTIKQTNAELDKRIALIGKSELESQIYNETTAKGIDLHSEEGQAIAAKVTKLWQAEQASKANELAEKRVNDLLSVRKQLQEQLEYHQSQGNTDAVVALRDRIGEVNTALSEAIEKAIALWEAVGGPEAMAKVEALRTYQLTLADATRTTLDAKAINEQFTQSAVTGFMAVGQAIAGWIDGTLSGKEALESIRDAFLQFASDFLRQIAQMILQQLIFNAISGGAGGGGTGGLGGWISGLIKHDGGMVDNGGTHRSVWPGWFANAVRYHTGGIAGLAPNEVPAVLEQGEEVLTRNDPRHAMNGGGSGKGVKIVNAIDSASVLDAAMNSRDGEETIINFLRANQGAVRSALGVG